MEPTKYKRLSYTVADYYLSYCDYVADNPLYQVSYTTFREIVTDYFRYLRDEIIENGKEVKLPCRLGTLSIVKHRPKEYTGKSLRIDYGESKKLGKMVFHLNEHSNMYKYRFLWRKDNILTKHKTYYQLVMTRANKRHLAQIIKNHVRDYIEL
jgi:hypothetical protein